MPTTWKIMLNLENLSVRSLKFFKKKCRIWVNFLTSRFKFCEQWGWIWPQFLEKCLKIEQKQCKSSSSFKVRILKAPKLQCWISTGLAVRRTKTYKQQIFSKKPKFFQTVMLNLTRFYSQKHVKLELNLNWSLSKNSKTL